MQQNQQGLVPLILCGGVGTRLWPLSRKHVPKQFTPILGEALFNLSLRRLSGLDIEDVVIASAVDHRFFVSEGLTEVSPPYRVSILLEPVVRDTAPAVALAALHIIETMGNRPMLVMPSDHMISDVPAFQQAVSQILSYLTDDVVVTFGITPNSAKTGYGYIKQGEMLGDGFFKAAQFCEKPDADTAREWVDSGNYCWNSGMFVFYAQAYLDLLSRWAPDVLDACCAAYQGRSKNLDFWEMQEQAYAKSPKISIDYAVMEKAERVILLPVDIGWSDVGSWQSLGDLMQHDSANNAVHGDVFVQDADDNIVHANQRFVSVLGVKNCVVVETSDAVLVAARDQSEDVKQLVANLQMQKREEVDFNRKVFRPWGSYEQIDCGPLFQVKRLIINPKQVLSLQMHHHRSEHWIVVKGKARVTRGDKVFDLEENQSTYIPKLTKHRLENCGEAPLFLIEVQCGDYLGEDDIVRFEDIYGRTKNTASQ